MIGTTETVDQVPTAAHGGVWAAKRSWRLPVPTIADTFFAVVAVIVPVGLSHSLLNSDGDAARHLRVGTYILEHRALFDQDVFSYTVQGQPFVPYEWLSEVVDALANRSGGLAAVAILAGLVIALTYALVARFLATHAVDPLLALATTALAIAGGSVHWLARPHLFTSLGSILTLALLVPAGRRRLWPFVPLFAAWANFHGGFIYGLTLIATVLLGDLIESISSPAPERARWREQAAFHARAFGVAVLASLINPAGPRIFLHVAGYLGNRYLLDWTQEYRSPSFHLPETQLFLVVLLLSIAVLAINRHRPSWPHLLIILVDVAFALYSGRNIPLYAVTALPVIAVEFNPTWGEILSAPSWLAQTIRRRSERLAIGDRQGRFGWWSGLVVVLLVILAVRRGEIAGMPLVDARFAADVFPVAAVEQARAQHLTGNLFNEFTWGGYLLYAWPEQRVFIDGQTDLYGERLTRTYSAIVDLEPGWREALRQWNVSLVIVPSRSKLAAELKREPGWQVWYQDQTAIILQRHG